MHKNTIRFSAVTLVVVALTGCATTRARKPDQKELSSQVEQLQSELTAKDQQIQDLQYQLDSYQQSLGGTSTNFSRSSKSAAIRVSGVTVKQVQKALANAGYDPGPADGKMGQKTKSAIKSFQRKNGLKADGIVGEKTWSLLN